MSDLNTDKTLIIEYLKQFPKIFVSTAEICKRANGRKRFDRDPEWARATLRRMVEEGWLITNQFGQYRLIDEALDDKKCNKADRIRRLSEAITAQVHKMEPTDDEKPFSILIKEIAQTTWLKLEGKKKEAET